MSLYSINDTKDFFTTNNKKQENKSRIIKLTKVSQKPKRKKKFGSHKGYTYT